MQALQLLHRPPYVSNGKRNSVREGGKVLHIFLTALGCIFLTALGCNTPIIEKGLFSYNFHI